MLLDSCRTLLSRQLRLLSLIPLTLSFAEAAHAQSSGASQVRYFPRVGYEYRMVGGQFQGSADNSTWTALYTITTAPSDAYTTATLTTDLRTFRYLRYLAPDGTYGNVAEVEFDSGTGTNAIKLAGTSIGTSGSYYGSGNDCTKALDGDTTTFFDAPYPGNGDYVGIDQGPGVNPSQVRFAPRPGYGYRMVGGQFQGSPDNSSWTTLTTIAQAPPDNQYSILPTIADPATFRYLRYLAPDGTYGNVGEIEFDSKGAKLTGTAFGTPGSYYGSGNDFTKAFDGNTGTYFDAPYPGNGDFVGIDQGAGSGLTLTSITVSPASATVNFNGTQQFTATALDQNSNALSPQPALTWSVDSGGVGAVSTAGSYSVGATAGTAMVRAKSGSVSGTATVTVALSVPAQPLGLTATPGDTTVALNWSGEDGGYSYNLYRGTASGGEGTTPYKTGINSLPFVDTGLTDGTTYYYQISAVNDSGISVFSAEVSATPMPAPAPPPSHLTQSQAIALAQAFCNAIGAPVTATPTATWPAPNRTPSQQPYHWQPRWLVQFPGQAEVEVVDATSVISHYYNFALSQRLSTANLPAGTPISASNAAQTATNALQASGQPSNELASSPTEQNSQMTNPPTQAGDIWTVVWTRQFGSVPYQQEQATVMLQAETGAVRALSLSFPAAPPYAGVGSVSSAQAAQTAQSLLTSKGLTGLTQQSVSSQIVQPTTYWQQNGNATPVPNEAGQVAWNCLYTDSNNTIYEVWVNANSGGIIGGGSYGIRKPKAQPIIKEQAKAYSQIQKVGKTKKVKS